MASISSSPRTVEEIFKDYTARRSALLRALTYGPSLSLSLSLSKTLIFFVLLVKMLISIEAISSSLLSQMWMNSTRFAIQVSFIFLNFCLDAENFGENE